MAARLDRDLAWALDPALWAREVLGFVPDERQAELLRSVDRRVIVNCTRQWGKSSTTAVAGAHELKYGRDPVVVIAAPGKRQADELALRFEGFTRPLGDELRLTKKNDLGSFFANGARLVPLPGSEATVRGVSAVTLLIVDEAARVNDDLRKALNPFLAVRNGRAWELSTPFGKRGFYWKHWSEGGAEWRRFRVPATECPRISAEFLASERRELGELWFRQEYLCEFVELVDSVFDHELIVQAMSRDVEPLDLGPERRGGPEPLDLPEAA